MMTRQRVRVRYDRFVLRGWTYPFHELRDQGKMSALVPETPEPRFITLDSKHVVEIRPGDVAIIYPQINYPIPSTGLLQPVQQPAPEPPRPAAAAVERAEEAIKTLKEAATSPPPPPSSVDDIEPEVVVEAESEPIPPRWNGASYLLLTEVKDGESLLLNAEYRSRLIDQLRIELDEVTNLEQHGAGRREWKGSTVAKRREEISAILIELQAIGAALEARGGG